MTANVHAAATKRYVYALDALKAPPGQTDSAQVLPARTLADGLADSLVSSVCGARARVSLVHVPAGHGFALKAVPRERFYFVLRGSMVADLDGRLHEAPVHHVLHVPANRAHGVAAGSAGAALVAVQAVSGDADGEVDLAAEFSSRVGVPARAASTNESGRTICYLYPIAVLDAVPDGECSAKVTPRNFVSKKSSSFGAAIHGEMLQVGLIRKGRGSGSKLHTHPNEQFNLVVEGKLVGEIGGGPLEAPTMNLIHMPPGIQHCTMASGEGDVQFFVVKDMSHGMAGPPVDGIEDGPRYLPGFGPQK